MSAGFSRRRATTSHIRHQFTMPVGIRARLDTARQTLTLLEPGVV